MPQKKIKTIHSEKPKGIFRLMWSVMSRSEKWYFVLLMLFCVVSSIGVLIPAQLTSVIISKLVGQPMMIFNIPMPDMSVELLVVLAFAATFFLETLRMIYRNRMELLVKRVVCNFRNLGYEWLVQPRKNMDLKMTQGDAVYRMNEAPESIVNSLKDFFSDIIRKIMIAVFALVFICMLDIVSLPIIAAGLVLVSVAAVIRARIEKTLSRKLEITKSAVANSVVNTIANLPIINLFRSMAHERAIFRQKIDDYYGHEKKFLRLRLVYWTFAFLFEYAVTFGIIYLCAVRVYAGTMIIGNIVIILSYVERIFTPVQDLGAFASKWVECQVKVERMANLRAKQSDCLPMNVVQLDAIDTIKLDHIDIQNGDIFMIKDVNLTFKKGELTVLYGESGCGKSTILKYICGLCENLSGNLLVNGEPVEHPYQLTEHMSVTMQSATIFNRAIKYNIIYPTGETTDETKRDEIIKNLKLESVYKRDYTDGTSQNLENMLSGGEKKRINISRGLLRPAVVYIFDEPTNDLDHGNAMMVIDYVENLKKDAIVICVSHDKRLLDRADRRFEIDHRDMLPPVSGTSESYETKPNNLKGQA
jgi:ABC-type transport system involved in cytochrome bd biosynthesis fused ATPase/permease subunit